MSTVDDKRDIGVADQDKGPTKPKAIAAGCNVSSEDVPIVLMSIALYLIFICYGGGIGGLGAAIPLLADRFSVPQTSLGFLYTARGSGYFLGAVGAGALLEYRFIPISHEHFLCCSIVVASIATGLMSAAPSLDALAVEVFITGVCYGCFDLYCNFILPSMWGARVQPWMQAMHACFGVGAIIGPSLVGALGFVSTFQAMSVMYMAPLLFIVTAQLYIEDRQTKKDQVRDLEQAGEVDNPMQMLRGGEERDAGSPGAMDAATGGAVINPLISGSDSGSGDRRSKSRSPMDGKHGQGGSKPSSHSPAPESSSSPGVHGGETPPEGEGQGEYAAPLAVKCCLALFYWLYVGVEVGYSGWVATFALSTHVTADPSLAAYLVSLFWGALTLGRLVAVPLAVYVPNLHMLRVQFAVTVLGLILVLSIGTHGYERLCGATFVVGYGCSSIFPLGLTMVQDYGFQIDSRSMTTCILGATLGEMMLPAIVGGIMGDVGAMGMPWTVLVVLLLVISDYAVIHTLLTRHVFVGALLPLPLPLTRSESDGGSAEGAGGKHHSVELSPMWAEDR